MGRGLRRGAWVATGLAAVLLGGLVSAPTRASAREADKDCSDFTSQAAAQTFFLEHGGSASNNFDDLDADHDGVACESDPCPCGVLTTPAPTPTPTPTPSSPPLTEPTPAPSSPPPIPEGEELDVYVIRDVDGDTVFVRYADGAEGYVRLIGVDTPEDVKPGYPVECGAREAARSMKAMATGRQATLYTDPSQDRFDTYGRLLAYLYVGGRNLDRVQIREGWGYTYVFEYPFQQTGSFRKAQATARRLDLGVWGDCGGDFHSAEPGKQR
jgi:endonuclease YncB( thermonuclease family)